jgi:hypothetical protein
MRCQSKQHLQPFHTCIGTPQVTQFMQQSQEQKHIRPGPNGEMFAPAPSTFCITWINPHYPSTTLLQLDNLSPSELVVAILAPGRKNIASS